MNPGTYPLPAKEHDTEKACLQKEGRQYLEIEKRRKNIGRGHHKTGPIGAELKLHHDARDDAYPEVDGKDLCPETIHPVIKLLPCQEPECLHDYQIAPEADRERREKNMEPYGRGKLES